MKSGYEETAVIFGLVKSIPLFFATEGFSVLHLEFYKCNYITVDGVPKMIFRTKNKVTKEVLIIQFSLVKDEHKTRGRNALF